MRQELSFVPPRESDADAQPFYASLVFNELHASRAINRHLTGIVPSGVFRGFDCVADGGLVVRVTSEHLKGHGVASVEYDNMSITVQQQHDARVMMQKGEQYIVLEVNYQWGTLTKQVDIHSEIDAATVKRVDIDAVADNQIVLCKVSVADDDTELTDKNFNFSERPMGGLDLQAHLNHPDPHSQYVIDVQSTAPLVTARSDNRISQSVRSASKDDLGVVKLSATGKGSTDAVVTESQLTSALNTLPSPPTPKMWIQIDSGDLNLNINDAKLSANNYINTNINASDFTSSVKNIRRAALSVSQTGMAYGQLPSIVWGFELSVMSQMNCIHLHPTQVRDATINDRSFGLINADSADNDGKKVRIYINRRVLDRYSSGLTVTKWYLYEYK